MSLPHLAPFIQPQPLCCLPRVYLWPRFCTAMEHTDPQTVAMRFCCGDIPVRCSLTSFVNLSSSIRLHPLGVIPSTVEARESTDMNMKSELTLNPHYDDTWGLVQGLTSRDSESVLTCNMEELKETLRRKKIGLANKGKVPWNKGKKHTPETRARIKERTRAAMKDPKVRKKLSESPHLHSEESKEKISSSLRQLWSERLKWKRSKDQFYSSWVESIAEAARRGGINEEELYWDSYEKFKRELASQQLHWASEKAKVKEKKKIQAEKRARKRIERMALLAQKEHKQKAEPKAKKKGMMSCKTREEEEELALSRQPNLTDKLVKIHGKKLIDKQSCSQAGVMAYLQSALDRFDIESMKREQKRSIVSLADQIQAAKSKRIQILAGGSAVVT